MKITGISPISISDSRGNPTIELEMVSGPLTVKASVPSGKSAGSKEALEKRDTDGGVSIAINGIMEIISPAIINKEFSSPQEIDELLIKLDGTKNKSNLGGNATLAVSIGATKLFALEQKKPIWKFISDSNKFSPQFPRLYMNMLNGGAHAGFSLPFQEYIVIVEGKPKSAYTLASKIYEELGIELEKTIGKVSLGDEGGYSPTFATIEKPFEILKSLISKNVQASLGVDVAATEFYEEDSYTILNKKYSTDELINLYTSLISEFGITSIEDPFAEDDVSGFIALTEAVKNDFLVVGDDLTVTNSKILKMMIDRKAGNALIVKPNQIGTLSEVYETAHMAHDSSWKIIASHRSGETDDSFISDLAVGIGAYGLKAGAPSQKERVAKYNRLIQIEREFGLV